MRILLEFIIRPLLLVANPMRSAVSSGSPYVWNLHGLGSWNITARTIIVSDEMGGRLVIALTWRKAELWLTPAMSRDLESLPAKELQPRHRGSSPRPLLL